MYLLPTLELFLLVGGVFATIQARVGVYSDMMSAFQMVMVFLSSFFFELAWVFPVLIS